MRDPFTFTICIEALFRGGSPALVEAGAGLMARALRTVIANGEGEGGG